MNTPNAYYFEISVKGKLLGTIVCTALYAETLQKNAYADLMARYKR